METESKFVISVESKEEGYQVFGPFETPELARAFIVKAKRHDRKVFLHDLQSEDTLE